MWGTESSRRGASAAWGGSKHQRTCNRNFLPPTTCVTASLARVRHQGSISELIALSPDSPLWPWQPKVRYHLLDMGAFPKDKLARRASLVAQLFRLEQRHSPEELRELLNEVAAWFRQHEGYDNRLGSW